MSVGANNKGFLEKVVFELEHEWCVGLRKEQEGEQHSGWKRWYGPSLGGVTDIFGIYFQESDGF